MSRPDSSPSVVLDLASVPQRPTLWHRVWTMALLWLGFGVFIGAAPHLARPSVIGVVAGLLAGVIVLTPMGVILGLIGGLWKETLAGGALGLLFGLGVGLVAGQGDLLRQANLFVIMGGLAGATLPAMLRTLRKSVLLVLRLTRPAGAP